MKKITLLLIFFVLPLHAAIDTDPTKPMFKWNIVADNNFAAINTDAKYWARNIAVDKHTDFFDFDRYSKGWIGLPNQNAKLVDLVRKNIAAKNFALLNADEKQEKEDIKIINSYIISPLVADRELRGTMDYTACKDVLTYSWAHSVYYQNQTFEAVKNDIARRGYRGGEYDEIIGEIEKMSQQPGGPGQVGYKYRLADVCDYKDFMTVSQTKLNTYEEQINMLIDGVKNSVFDSDVKYTAYRYGFIDPNLKRKDLEDYSQYWEGSEAYKVKLINGVMQLLEKGPAKPIAGEEAKNYKTAKNRTASFRTNTNQLPLHASLNRQICTDLEARLWTDFIVNAKHESFTGTPAQKLVKLEKSAALWDRDQAQTARVLAIVRENVKANKAGPIYPYDGYVFGVCREMFN